jgi:hypothetical protein
MKSLQRADDRQTLLARLDRISDMTLPQWGSLTAERMLAHLGESMKMATGAIDVKAKSKLLLRTFPVKHLIVYLLPFPKGVPTSPELLAGACGSVDAARAEIRRLFDEFAARSASGRWPSHPTFGLLTARQWGVLTYRHFDHHLRQFGV